MTIISLKEQRMARKRRNSPQSRKRAITDPAEGARLGKPTPDQWGVNLAALDLPANASIETREYRGQVTGRCRYDCFELLFRRRVDEERFPATWLNAIRRLQVDLSILHRTQGVGDAIRVTGKGASGAIALGRGELDLRRFVTAGFGAARVMAGERVHAVLSDLPEWCARLILALCEPEIASGQSVNWHATVMRVTGEIDRGRRGERVRDCCRELASAYARLDNAPRRATG